MAGAQQGGSRLAKQDACLDVAQALARGALIAYSITPTAQLLLNLACNTCTYHSLVSEENWTFFAWTGMFRTICARCSFCYCLPCIVQRIVYVFATLHQLYVPWTSCCSSMCIKERTSLLQHNRLCTNDILGAETSDRGQYNYHCRLVCLSASSHVALHSFSRFRFWRIGQFLAQEFCTQSGHRIGMRMDTQQWEHDGDKFMLLDVCITDDLICDVVGRLLC